MKKWNKDASGEIQIEHQYEVLHWEAGHSLEQGPQGPGHSTKFGRVQGEPEQHYMI